MPKKGSKKAKKPQKLHDQKVKCKNCRSGDNKKLDGVWGEGEGHALGWGSIENALNGPGRTEKSLLTPPKIDQNLKKAKKGCGIP